MKGTVQNSNLYKYNIGTTSTDWITNTSYIWKGLMPNTSYTVKLEAVNKEGSIVTGQKIVYTKAQIPEVSVVNAYKAPIDINIKDSNPATTEYQVISGISYVTLTLAPT